MNKKYFIVSDKKYESIIKHKFQKENYLSIQFF
jgi:hypothetical protein